VLLADDDGDVRDVLQLILEDAGFVVLTAANGREALDHLSGGARPCVVLLDLMMPVMNGWEVLKHLRAHVELSKLPVVVLSAVSNLGQGVPGARSVLYKPVSTIRLLQAVEEHCGGAP
jgi:CheY-like chemotaxis protein